MDIIAFLSEHNDILLLISAFLSLFIGSFLNVVIYRLPRMMQHEWSEECRIYLGLKPHTEPDKLNLSLPASHCPSCKKSIRPWHNIPVFSYFWLRGRCSFCHAHISLRYPLVEALTALLSMYVVWKFGISLQTISALIFTWIIICLTFIDLDHHLLPDQLTLLLLWCGLVSSLFPLFCNSFDAITGAIAGYSIFALTQWAFGRITGKIGMGQGDFKFLAAIGAYFGWQMLPLAIILSCICGITIAFTHMIIKKNFKSVPLPFGPYLAIAGWVILLWGNEIMRYYFEVI